MTKNLLKILAAIALTPGACLASTAAYPYIAPDAKCPIVRVNDGIGGVAFSQNCKTAFLLPPAKGTAKIIAFAPSENLKACANLDHDILSMQKMTDLRDQVETRRMNEASDAIAFERDSKIIESLNSDLNSLKSFWANVEGATIEVQFDDRVTQEAQDRFYADNVEAISLGLGVMLMPISQGFLSFSVPTTGTIIPSVISTTVPGLRTRKDDPQAVVFNGAASGQVVLSLAGACPFVVNGKIPLTVDDLPIAAEGTVAKSFSAHLVANYTYAVPFLSGISYTATFNLDRALDVLVTSNITSGQFSLEQASSLIIADNGADSSQALKFEVHGYEVPLDLQDQYRDYMKTEVTKIFTAELLNELAALDVVKLVPVNAQPVAGGTTTTATPTQSCHWVGSTWEYPGGHNQCDSGVNYVSTFHNGLSTAGSSVKGKIHMDATQSSSVDGIIYRTNTSTFEFKKGK